MMDGQWTETEFERQMNVVRVQDRYPQIKKSPNAWAELLITMGVIGLL